MRQSSRPGSAPARSPVLVAGSKGMLAGDLLSLFEKTGTPVIGVDLPELDITNPESVRSCFDALQPRLAVNCAAFTDVDGAEAKREAAYAVNREGPAHLAEACRRLDIPLIHISTDFVFDGTAGRPCREDDPVTPRGVYAASKWEGEEAIRGRLPRHVIVRSAWLFGAGGRNFVKTILRLGSEREELRVVADQYGCPTWTVDLAGALVRIASRTLDGLPEPEWGTYHFCGEGWTTWHGFAEAILREGRERMPVKCTRVLPITTAEYPCAARRPSWSVLDCSKIESVFGIVPPPWQIGLEQTVEALCPKSS